MTAGRSAPEAGRLAACSPAPSRQPPRAGSGPARLPNLTLRPSGPGSKVQASLRHAAEAGFEHGVAFQCRGRLPLAGGRDRGSPQDTCGLKASARLDLLLSVEYDEFLPHRLQTLLQVSILSKGTER